ncbi:dihydroorotase [Citrobacter koseri]|uniref:Dihydroorotase n=1 Tax=Citrobacter koseri TaxID=545 RepID=A0A447UQI1_CITKO|nr:dihydroorotase [Citrobacter koseri]
MYDLLLRRARLVDDTVSDIALKDGKIARAGQYPATGGENRRSARRVLTLAQGGLIPTSTAIRNPRFITMSRTASVLRQASPPLLMRAVPAQTTLMISTR